MLEIIHLLTLFYMLLMSIDYLPDRGLDVGI